MVVRWFVLAAGVGALCAVLAPWGRMPARYKPKTREWNRVAANAYLDARMISWEHGGGMENGTFCISCHTGMPFALARPDGAVHAQVIASVEKRVDAWPSVQPYLGDHGKGFGTEAVINALTLAARDARAGHLSPTTRKAFDIFWATQLTTGPDAGAWPWVNFGNEPWEAPDSVYWGAAVSAVAVGMAPDGYRKEPQIQHGLSLLEAYLRRPDPGRSLMGQVGLLWASSKLPGLLSPNERGALVSQILASQNADGGWSTASLLVSSWKRRDGTAESGLSDGYGTGLVAVALKESGLAGLAAARALNWLRSNQDPATGGWPAVSPNAVRDPKSDVGHFMTDASTVFAVLALESAPP